MKITKLIILCSAMFYCTNGLFAQNWAIGGNPNADIPAGGGRLGSNGARDVIFETNNVERARLLNTSGFWGFGTAVPTARVHINSDPGTAALRIQVNGATRAYLNSAGRFGIGTLVPAANFHVFDGDDASPGGGGYIVAGSTSGANIAIDENEIMARSNGAASPLFLNHNGGDLIINGTNAATNVGIGTTSPIADLHVFHDFGSYTSGLRLQNENAPNNFWNLYTRGSGDLELSINGNVLRGLFSSANGVYTSFSDKRMKKDIEKSPDVLSKVLQLEVTKYHVLENKPADPKYFGLIAQDVEKLFPEIVYHTKSDGSADDVYTMDYSAFGVLAIKALQEQHKETTILKERIAKLEAALNAVSDKNISTKETLGVSLEQNMPNPFNQSTTIKYHLPKGANATLMVYNSNGAVVKTVKATDSGNITIQAYELSAGTYTYSLVVNGKIAASKKMVLLK